VNLPGIKKLSGLIMKAIVSDRFSVIINETTFPIHAADAAAISPAIRDLLSIDACATQFNLSDDEIDAADIPSLDTIFSGGSVFLHKSDLPRLALLARRLSNPELEILFLQVFSSFSLSMNDTITLTAADLFAWSSPKTLLFTNESPIYTLSIEAWDILLSSKSLVIESENAFFQMLLKLDFDYRQI
jgi:hypothetical protein